MPRLLPVAAEPSASEPPGERVRTERQRRGDQGEQRALEFLCSRGLSLVERNVGSRLGEVDLLMRDGDTWVFVEVRVRASRAFGGAAASVGPSKQRRVRRQAQAILKRRFGDGAWPACRFDVCAIEGGEVDWIPDAF